MSMHVFLCTNKYHILAGMEPQLRMLWLYVISICVSPMRCLDERAPLMIVVYFIAHTGMQGVTSHILLKENIIW
ncbi:hypothetical protein KSP39_PZI016239 [Platanthera zijinensis]|uniref:Uncharacterized protein n=1 Tax=Platanthera zijinensis TaxID=2320716 RepID=A0AAP0G108_9ASPA